MAFKRSLRSHLEPEKVLLLQGKLQAGEISEDDCRELLKRMMLKGLAGGATTESLGRRFGRWFAKHAQGL